MSYQQDSGNFVWIEIKMHFRVPVLEICPNNTAVPFSSDVRKTLLYICTCLSMQIDMFMCTQTSTDTSSLFSYLQSWECPALGRSTSFRLYGNHPQTEHCYLSISVVTVSIMCKRSMY